MPEIGTTKQTKTYGDKHRTNRTRTINNKNLRPTTSKRGLRVDEVEYNTAYKDAIEAYQSDYADRLIELTQLDGQTVGVNKEYIVSLVPLTETKHSDWNAAGEQVPTTITTTYTEVNTTQGFHYVKENIDTILNLPHYL